MCEDSGYKTEESYEAMLPNQEVPGRGKCRSVQIYAAQMCQRGIILCVMQDERG